MMGRMRFLEISYVFCFPAVLSRLQCSYSACSIYDAHFPSPILNVVHSFD